MSVGVLGISIKLSETEWSRILSLLEADENSIKINPDCSECIPQNQCINCGTKELIKEITQGTIEKIYKGLGE